jgi:hypothetical protein
MKRMSMAVAAAVLTLTLQATAQDQQGQGQQGQAQQGQGQQGQAQGQGQQGGRQIPGVSLRKFVITLALGEVGSGPVSNFTPAAERALADLRGFLPYKTYTLLDTVFKIGLSGPPATVKGVGVGTMYELVTNGGPGSTPNRTSVRLLLRTAGQPTLHLIDTQFEIEMGETVVVGTSRLDGNRALLLLVTSVP